MEEEKSSRLDSQDDSFLSEADLTNQLRDKIRGQAHRLRSLEHYRMLCEQRIQELYPNHPIPITKSHFGTLPPEIQELNLAKDKIFRLENQISQQNLDTEDSQDLKDYTLLLEKYNDLLRDKRDIEESLRAEMLNCEEQRTYIEYLKQSAEGTEDFEGFSIDPKASGGFNSSRGRIDENKRECMRFKHTIMDLESQIKRMQGNLRGKDSEVENLVKERHELDNHLRQAADALQIAEEEVAKLENDKATLMDYVEMHSMKEKEMERELNDLSRYFEEMKIDFHETLAKLESLQKVKGMIEEESEGIKNELSKSLQTTSSQQSFIENLKKIASDKEALVKIAKEEKLDAEIKIEKLQANIDSLSESLTNTQLSAKKLQEIVDSISQQESKKIEKVTESLKFELNSVQGDLDIERKYRSELERMRELDIRQIQDFKSKILDLQTKCEIFDNLKKSRNDYEYSKKIDLSRISKLEEEINYLQETCREIQHREATKEQMLNDLKIQNSNLNSELEEVYSENDNLRMELSKYSKEAEVFAAKFQHLNEFCESLENDKIELEELLQLEKQNSKLLKEQTLNDKSKIEDMQRSLHEHSTSIEKHEKISQEQELENKTLKQQFKSSEREVEGEKQSKLKLLAEVRDLSGKIENRDREMDKLNNEIANCCKLISAFCGKCTISYNDYRSCLSTRYKEYLDTWKEGHGSHIENIKSWISSTIEEIQLISKFLFQSNIDLKSSLSELSAAQSRFQESNSGEVIYKQHALKLKEELDEVYQKYEILLEQSQEEINTYKREASTLKNEIYAQNNERISLTEALKSSLHENQCLKTGSFSSRVNLRLSEERNSLLQSTKSLNLSQNASTGKIKTTPMSRSTKIFQTTELLTLSNQIFKFKNELERTEKNKSYLESELSRLGLGADPATTESEQHKNLVQQLESYKKQIRFLNNSIQDLQDELERAEEIQKSQEIDREKARKNMICRLNHDPNTCPLLHSNYYDSNATTKNRSQYS